MSRTDRPLGVVVGAGASGPSVELRLLGPEVLAPSAANPSVLVAAADTEAVLARAAVAGLRELSCDACAGPLEAEPAGLGLLVWSRGGELRFEEPPLCERCATAIGTTMLRAYEDDGDDEG